MSRYSRPCRYGPECHYLARGQCWFSHPSWHSTRNSRPTSSYLSNNLYSSRLYMREDSPDQDSYSYNPYSGIVRRSTTYSNQRSQSLNELLSLFRMLGLHQNKKKQDPKQKPQPLKLERKQSAIKKVKVNGVEVKALQFESKLTGMKKQLFSKCDHFKHFKQSGLQQCSICITNFELKDDVSKLSCSHGFHTDCIQKWIEQSNYCPLCRKDISKSNETLEKPSSITSLLELMRRRVV